MGWKDAPEVAQPAWMAAPEVAPAKPAAPEYSPTGGFMENAVVGFGKSMVDTGRGLQQLWAAVSRNPELAARVQAGLPLWHEDDRADYEEPAN